ncbi:Rap1a/Tai family immunity protein [Falsiroseomonas bella]|uniref:Rap1a/Tai family immunity protein n=1 Tax=Falsiroseomonas bella TaxID=2184016 RepID=UPI0011B698EF|nr:Rap1a/Tai family immunity protein [Falsiroseomonas bella]
MRWVLPVLMATLVNAACTDGKTQPSPPIQVQNQSPAAAGLDPGSANFIMAGCHDFIARSGDLSTAYQRGLCVGKVEGVAVFATGVCYPPEATLGQMIRVVARYIDDRPARLHENFLVLAQDAMRAAWPCRR